LNKGKEGFIVYLVITGVFSIDLSADAAEIARERVFPAARRISFETSR
jgi:hypothetical protein